MWANRPHHGKCFIKDGIIDPSLWEAAKPKVLFLLKESYDTNPNATGWDLRAQIRDTGGAKWRIWWNAAYWCYAAHHVLRGTLPVFPAVPEAYNEASRLFLGSAVVNVKKSNGQPVSVDEDIASYVEKDGDLIRQQVELIAPDIVICGNVWCWVRKLWGEAAQVYDLGWCSGNRIFIDWWHPSWQAIPNQLYYYGMGTVLQNTISHCRCLAAVA